ncbi:hypothetical protein ACJX0J_021059, partial [Zea mays]
SATESDAAATSSWLSSQRAVLGTMDGAGIAGGRGDAASARSPPRDPRRETTALTTLPPSMAHLCLWSMGEGIIIDIMTLESGLREDTHPMGAELRESKLMNKYNELKEAGKLDAFMERRRSKNASKDH